MNTKHTPGPWVFEPQGIHHLILTADFDEDMGAGEVICNTRDSAKSMANAQLIAVAPALLAACETFDKLFWPVLEGWPDATQRAIERNHAVIAQARGEVGK